MEYVKGKRYAALNGNKVINAWTTLYSFQADVQAAKNDAAAAVAIANEAQAILPTISAQIEELDGVISDGQQRFNTAIGGANQAVENANDALAAGLQDLVMLSSGFNFKEVAW